MTARRTVTWRVWFCLAAALSASAAWAAAPPEKPQSGGTLKLKANSIVFDRSKGTALLRGDVHVARTSGKETLTVDCDQLDAQMTDGRMTAVKARGNVRVEASRIKATAARADFDFDKNVITLYGTKDKPATATTAEMKSWGQKIIFYPDSERVDMPDGGETQFILKAKSPRTK